jgi:D-alanyl-lipoteichoic acid acyltransferase DltB (MBOAT superfamily)
MMKGRLKGRVNLNLVLTTSLIGVWHGANFTFLAFGIWHSLIAVLHRALAPLWKTKSWSRSQLWIFFCWLTYFHILIIGMIFFRAEDLTHTLSLFQQLTSLNFSFSTQLSSWVIFAFMIGIITHLPRASQWDIIAQKFIGSNLFAKWSLSIIIFTLMFASLQMAQGQAAFIYFRF